MAKYFHGISFEKKTIEKNGEKQDIVIAMTEKEHEDRSYREYLENSIIEKTENEMARKPKKEIDPKKREALGKLLGEIKKYERSRNEPLNKKYYFLGGK